jgi:hypothetical protein
LAKQIADVREQIRVLEIELGALVRLSGAEPNGTSGGRVGSNNGAKPDAAPGQPRTRVVRSRGGGPTLRDQFYEFVKEKHVDGITRADVIKHFENSPALVGRVEDPRKNAQTIIAKLIKDKLVLVASDGRLSPHDAPYKERQPSDVISIAGPSD